MKPATRSLVENGLIVLGILTLWPWVFGIRGLWYLVLSIAVLVGLGWLGVVRFLRIKRAFDEQERNISEP